MSDVIIFVYSTTRILR